MWRRLSQNLLTTKSTTIIPFATSRWSPQYVEPIVTKAELDYIKENDPDRYTSLKYNRPKALLPHKNNNEFYDPFLYKLIGRITKKGARERADKLVKETLFLIKKDRLEKCRELSANERLNFERDPIKLLKEGWDNCKPVVKVVQVTRGGSKYFSPVPVCDDEKDKIVFQWVREVIENRPRPRPEKFPQVFSRELLLACKNEGKLIKKKLDLYRLCEANKAYVNYVYLKQKANKGFK